MDTQEIKAFFDQKAESYVQKPERENARREIVKLANIKQGSTIIDLAGGRGVMTKLMLEYRPKKIIINDLSSKMIMYAKQEIDDERVEFVEGNFFDISFEKADVIMLFNAFPHFEDKKLLAKKTFECLNENGKLIICHDSSKDIINGIHKNNLTNDSFSRRLKSPLEVYKDFNEYFDNISTIDSDIFYLEMQKNSNKII